MYKCPHCGGDLEFEPGSQVVKCRFCDSVIAVSELTGNKYTEAEVHEQDVYDGAWNDADQEDKVQEEELRKAENDRNGAEQNREMKVRIYTCPQCGGEIMTTDETAVTFCSYCGSQVTLTERLASVRMPDEIIPFRITKEQCAELYKKKVSKAFFAPSFMKEDMTVEKFRGIYLPYWIYSIGTGKFIGNGEISHREGDWIVHDHYCADISTDGYFDGISYDGSSAFSDEISSAIAPFDSHQLQKFSPEFMSGFYADVCDVPNDVYKQNAENDVVNIAQKQLLSPQIKAKGITSLDGVPQWERARLGYFPVWFMTVRYKERICSAAVNGQTGKVYVDIPVDYKKFLLLALIIAVPAALLLILALTLKPLAVTVISALVSIVMLIIMCVSIKRVYASEKGLNDAGKQYAENKADGKYAAQQPQAVTKKKGNGLIAIPIILFVCTFISGAIGTGKLPMFFFILMIVSVFVIAKKRPGGAERKVVMNVKVPASYRMKFIWKNIAAIAVCLIVALINPVEDLVYYAVDLAAIVLAGLSVLDVVRVYNILSLRPIPQLGKRGGDESGR